MNFIGTLRTIMRSRSLVQVFVAEEKRNGQEFDRRLDSITKATLNGEKDWFLELVEKDPDCALKVIRECDSNDPKVVK